MNCINIIGNLTADPVLGTDKDGPACFFKMAVNRIGSENADFFEVKAKGKQAENLCKYKKKGDKLGITGEMRSWKKEGEEYYRWLLAAHGIDYCDSRRSEQEKPPANPSPVSGATQGGNGGSNDGGYRRARR